MSGDAGSFEPDLGMWDAWTPAQLAAKLERADATWYVLAGWALDLFQGRQTSEHEDLEIGVPAYEFVVMRGALAELALFVVGDGRAWPLGEAALSAHRQTWAREQRAGSRTPSCSSIRGIAGCPRSCLARRAVDSRDRDRRSRSPRSAAAVRRRHAARAR
jgi:hypothetical protein